MQNEFLCFLDSVALKPSHVLVVPCGCQYAFKRKMFWNNFDNYWFKAIGELEAESRANLLILKVFSLYWELLSGLMVIQLWFDKDHPEGDAQKPSQGFSRQ